MIWGAGKGTGDGGGWSGGCGGGWGGGWGGDAGGGGWGGGGPGGVMAMMGPWSMKGKKGGGCVPTLGLCGGFPKGMGRGKPSPTKKVFIGGIKNEAGEDAVKEWAEAFGPVQAVRVLRDELGRSKGYAFVDFEAAMPKTIPTHRKTASISADVLHEALTVNSLVPDMPMIAGYTIPNYAFYTPKNSSDFIPTLENLNRASKGLRINQSTMEAGWDVSFKKKFTEGYKKAKGRAPTADIISGYRFIQCRQLRIMLAHFQKDQAKYSTESPSRNGELDYEADGDGGARLMRSDRHGKKDPEEISRKIDPDETQREEPEEEEPATEQPQTLEEQPQTLEEQPQTLEEQQEDEQPQTLEEQQTPPPEEVEQPQTKEEPQTKEVDQPPTEPPEDEDDLKRELDDILREDIEDQKLPFIDSLMNVPTERSSKKKKHTKTKKAKAPSSPALTEPTWPPSDDTYGKGPYEFNTSDGEVAYLKTKRRHCESISCIQFAVGSNPWKQMVQISDASWQAWQLEKLNMEKSQASEAMIKYIYQKLAYNKVSTKEGALQMRRSIFTELGISLQEGSYDWAACSSLSSTRAHHHHPDHPQ
ncbi:unnamed protein product [Prorocentrum cordatum]|uniref:RRM domain-containing protein n=1 Tax=Prorocentrum cordatum TaxID=2364126 RepID=A0ABN9SHC5_9DINO|nr:unnamed protein product [Polarella glacialis]